ncbi:MAG: PDZ domain-containing protein [Chloroflexi bacterium]|nr:MAG: PDZ domain-containing protein [Chloroflexota bacterium]
MATNENSLVALSDAMAEAVEKVGAATVTVDARRRFPASGILYSNDLVLTADHVVEREEDIQIFLPAGGEATASIAGRDPGSDLALLRLSRSASQTAEMSQVDPRVGQLVLAVARPTAEGIQASLGIISAIGGPIRTGRGVRLERYISTDAVPYPGFSGGPLIDASGRVIGMNTSGLTRGASIAIPVSQVRLAVESLLQHGKIRRGYLGVRSQPVELPVNGMEALGRAQTSGLLIVGIEPDGPASASGLMVGDILVGIDGDPISDHDELLSRLSGSLVGAQTQVEILRGGKPVSVPVTVGERS